MARRSRAPRGHVYEISAEAATTPEVGGRHLWLIISGPEVRRDGLVIGLPLTGQAISRTNYDVPYRPDDIDSQRDPIGMSLKSEGDCYVLTSKPRHFAVSRLPETHYGVMADPVIHSALQRMGSALHANLSAY